MHRYFSLLLLLGLTLSACNKDWDCQCTSPDGSVITWPINNKKKGEAKDICGDIEGDNTEAEAGTSCKLR